MSGMANVAFLVSMALGIIARADDTITRLTAAGATFPQPLYETMIARFMQLHPDIQINYGGGGSGQGITGIIDKTLAFAGSDAPMNAQELRRAGGAQNIIQVPSCAGAVVPAYNLPGDPQLNFTGSVLADIYLGRIIDWNDPQIAAINPGIALPDLPITPAYRSDGSGTNYVWSNYLAGQSDEFKTTVGFGKAVEWPLGQGGAGNPGVAAIIKQTYGALGYVEQNYADRNGLRYGRVRNKAGQFAMASPECVSRAGQSVADRLSGDVLKANIWDQPGRDVYPISSFTYLIAYKDLRSARTRQQAQAVVDFFWFATHDGQVLAPGLFYAPLAPEVQKKIESALDDFTFQGEAVHHGD
jgi:phosphate transport system substrate-binding protein